MKGGQGAMLTFSCKFRAKILVTIHTHMSCKLSIFILNMMYLNVKPSLPSSPRTWAPVLKSVCRWVHKSLAEMGVVRASDVSKRERRGEREGGDLCRKEGKVYQMGRVTTSPGLPSDELRGKFKEPGARGTLVALE